MKNSKGSIIALFVSLLILNYSPLSFGMQLARPRSRTLSTDCENFLAQSLTPNMQSEIVGRSSEMLRRTRSQSLATFPRPSTRTSRVQRIGNWVSSVFGSRGTNQPNPLGFTVPRAFPTFSEPNEPENRFPVGPQNRSRSDGEGLELQLSNMQLGDTINRENPRSISEQTTLSLSTIATTTTGSTEIETPGSPSVGMVVVMTPSSINAKKFEENIEQSLRLTSNRLKRSKKEDAVWDKIVNVPDSKYDLLLAEPEKIFNKFLKQTNTSDEIIAGLNDLSEYQSFLVKAKQENKDGDFLKVYEDSFGPNLNSDLAGFQALVTYHENKLNEDQATFNGFEAPILSRLDQYGAYQLGPMTFREWERIESVALTYASIMAPNGLYIYQDQIQKDYQTRQRNWATDPEILSCFQNMLRKRYLDLDTSRHNLNEVKTRLNKAIVLSKKLSQLGENILQSENLLNVNWDQLDDLSNPASKEKLDKLTKILLLTNPGIQGRVGALQLLLNKQFEADLREMFRGNSLAQLLVYADNLDETFKTEFRRRCLNIT